VVENEAEAQRPADLAEGSLSRAVELADQDLWAFRDQFLAELARVDETSVALAREVGEFVDSAGKDAPSRRRRLRQIIRLAIDFHLEQLRAATASGDSPEQLQRLASLVERSLEGLGQVDRNAHQATLIDCWLDELGQTQAGRGALDSAE
jgi:DNA polymerase III subunit delta'